MINEVQAKKLQERIHKLIGLLNSVDNSIESQDRIEALLHQVLDIFDSEVNVNDEGEPTDEASRKKMALARSITLWLNYR